jgi:hypothetical protein
VTLAVYSRVRRVGRITLAGGKLTGSAPGVQNIADTAVRKAGGDPQAAYAALDGFTNGYITVITDPAEQNAARQGGATADGQPWTATGHLPGGAQVVLSWDGGLAAGWDDDAIAWLADAASSGQVQGDSGASVLGWLRKHGFTDTPGAAAGDVWAVWDPELHPRDERGRFTNRARLLALQAPPGTRRTAVPAGEIRAGDWLALGHRKGGYQITAVTPGGQPGSVRLHLEGGGRIMLAGDYHRPGRRQVPVYRHDKPPAPKPPPPAPPAPDTPEELFTSMAGSYYFEPGVTNGQKQKVAAALARLPAGVRQDLKDFRLMRRISIREHKWESESPEGTIVAIGQYNIDSRVLTIAADSPDLAQTADHEALHAWDRLPSGWMGRFSNQADFKKLAGQIRDIEQHNRGMVGAHYAPYGGPQWLVKSGNMELFAELGSDYLNGQPYNLNLAYRGTSLMALGPRITARLDDYFTGVFTGATHQLTTRQRNMAPAAAAPGDVTSQGGLSCTKVTMPDGSTGWLFTDAAGREINPETGEPAGTAGGPPPELPGGQEGPEPATPAGDEPWTLAGTLPDGTRVTLGWDGGCAGWPGDALGWLLDAVAAGEVAGDDSAEVREWLQVRGFTTATRAAFRPDETRDNDGKWTTSGGTAGKPPKVLAALARQVEIEPGADQARLAPITAALAKLPAPVRDSIRGHLVMIDVAPKLYYGGSDQVLGEYAGGDLHLLMLATRPDADVTAVHEALHAYDAGPDDDYTTSSSPAWRQLAAEIRASGVPVDQVYRDDSDRANREMFAELGALDLLGKPLTLDRAGGETLDGLAGEIRAQLGTLTEARP